MQKYAKWSWALGMLVAGFSSLAAADCYRFQGGDHNVTVGWFSRKTHVADGVCVEGNYAKRGFSSGLKFVLKRNARTVASYAASSERYSDADVRFTLADGEPEPTQFDAKIQGRSLTKLKLEGNWVQLSN